MILLIETPPAFSSKKVWQEFLEDMLDLRKKHPSNLDVKEAVAKANAALAKF
jgi:hypothetical protein